MTWDMMQSSISRYRLSTADQSDDSSGAVFPGDASGRACGRCIRQHGWDFLPIHACAGCDGAGCSSWWRTGRTRRRARRAPSTSSARTATAWTCASSSVMLTGALHCPLVLFRHMQMGTSGHERADLSMTECAGQCMCASAQCDHRRLGIICRMSWSRPGVAAEVFFASTVRCA